MPYPARLLNDDETIVADFHPHWIFFAEAVVALIASIALGIFALTLDDGSAKDTLRWISLVLIVGTALWVVARYAKWVTSNFVITSDRIIYRAGLVRKEGIDIPLERVNTIKMRQGAIERLFRAGDLMIESGGETGQQRFTDIRNPEQVQRLIYAQMDLNDDRVRQAMGGAPTSDVASQLERLEGMLERGTLTPEEFEAQKRKLLGP
jgi:uncharacterized membrane protein YdbT with pleckstrin-like domain